MMLGHQARAQAAGMLQELGLDVAILGSAAPSDFPRLASLSVEASDAAALAAWALDRGMSGDVAGTLRDALRLSNGTEDAIRDALGLLPRLMAEWPAAGVAAKKRMANHPGYQAAWWLLETTSPESAQAIAAEVADLAQGIGLAPGAAAERRRPHCRGASSWATLCGGPRCSVRRSIGRVYFQP